MREDHNLALGLNTYGGQLTNEPVASAHGLPHTDLSEVLG
jgi:alanine dehydrogenase